MMLAALTEEDIEGHSPERERWWPQGMEAGGVAQLMRIKRTAVNMARTPSNV